MSAPENSDLLTIDVSADDYAKIAATDQEVPEVDERKARTHQSEADFQAEKATYTAKIDNGNIWKALSGFDPPFPAPTTTTTTTTDTDTDTNTTAATATQEASTGSEEEPATTKRKLEKKEWQLISAAVGELYWAGDYEKVAGVCEWCDTSFDMERKMAESVKRWREKSGDKLRGPGAAGGE